MEYTTETVHITTSSAIERLVKKILSKRFFDVVVDQGFVLQRDARVIEVDVVDTGISLEDYARVVKWRDYGNFDPTGDYLIVPLLSYLSHKGHIPAGKWFIRIE